MSKNKAKKESKKAKSTEKTKEKSSYQLEKKNSTTVTSVPLKKK